MNHTLRYALFFLLVFAAVWLFLRGEPPHEALNMATVTDETFTSEVREADGLTLVYFWATWCGICRRVTPVLDDLAAEYRDVVPFVKIDIDESPNTAERYRVDGVPYVYLFKDGVAVDARAGAYSPQSYRNWIERHL